MEMFLLFCYYCACIGLVQISESKNIVAIVDNRTVYEGADVTWENGYVGTLFTHQVIDSNDVFTGVALSTGDSKLENITPTQVIQVYRFLGDHLAFKLLNGEYVEQYQDPCQKYLYYEVVDGVIKACTLFHYYKMIVPFYNPCKYIELSGPSCHFNKSITDSGVVVYDIVGTIYAAEVRAHSKLVYYNRASTTNRIVKIRNYRIHYIPFIDIQFVNYNDSLYTIKIVMYMDSWVGFTELREKLNLLYKSRRSIDADSPLRYVTEGNGQFGVPLHGTGVQVVSHIPITIDLEMTRESTALVTVEDYKDEYGEINVYICHTICVFGDVFLGGSKIFAAGEHSPFILSLHKGLEHNVVYALTMQPESVQLREYTQFGDSWALQMVEDATMYFYLLVLDPKEKADRRLYSKDNIKDGKFYMDRFIPRKFIGFSAVLVEENGSIIKRSIENVVFTEVRLRHSLRKFIYYQNGRKMMMMDTCTKANVWTHGILAALPDE